MKILRETYLGKVKMIYIECMEQASRERLL